MKAFILTLVILMGFSMSTHADVPAKRLVETSQGSIDLDLFEKALSTQLATNVRVYKVYNSLNPANSVVGFLSEFKNYSVVLKINNLDFAWCTLTLMAREKKALVVGCWSPSVTIEVPGMISYSEMGLSSEKE